MSLLYKTSVQPFINPSFIEQLLLCARNCADFRGNSGEWKQTPPFSHFSHWVLSSVSPAANVVVIKICLFKFSQVTSHCHLCKQKQWPNSTLTTHVGAVLTGENSPKKTDSKQQILRSFFVIRNDNSRYSRLPRSSSDVIKGCDFTVLKHGGALPSAWLISVSLPLPLPSYFRWQWPLT